MKTIVEQQKEIHVPVEKQRKLQEKRNKKEIKVVQIRTKRMEKDFQREKAVF